MDLEFWVMPCSLELHMRLYDLRFGASLLNMKNLVVAKLREAMTLGQFWSFNFRETEVLLSWAEWQEDLIFQ